MTTVLLVIHLLITVFLIGIILIQRSEGGALGIGGSPMGGLMTARGSANFLTRATSYLAIGFFITSISLALVASNGRSGGSFVDQIQSEAPAQTAPAANTGDAGKNGDTAPQAPLPQ